MTVTEQTSSSSNHIVTTNLYRDVHKGIRAELFSVTAEAGRIDPDSDAARVGLAAHVRNIVDLLEGHARHEDMVIQPALQAHLPDLAARIEADHELRRSPFDRAGLHRPTPWPRPPASRAPKQSTTST